MTRPSVASGAPARRWSRWLVAAVVAALLAVAAGGLGARAHLRASLPVVEGERVLSGLADPVRVERDAFGVPVVRGRSREDVARATGFLHAQERFFQMDLLRRRAAGELSELVGEAALSVDRETRVLRLRAVARRALSGLPANQRTLVRGYADGVAAGLSALGSAPFEYSVLRSNPRPWQEEDTLLCALAMALSLQDDQPARESTLGVMRDTLPPALAAFLAPPGTEWDAPLEGGPMPAPELPGPEVLDLRTRAAVANAPLADAAGIMESDASPAGSNNWAVAAAYAADGHALVANDMHLRLGVPNTWYRVSLVFETAQGTRGVTGVTLPGTPFVIAGSNGSLAWGFTNSEGDWTDLVELEPVDGEPDSYRTHEGPRRFEHTREEIRIRGGESRWLEVRGTVFGPVVDVDHAGRARALAWAALRPGGIDLGLLRLETATSVAEAQAIAPEVGMPQQNLVAADTGGHVGWTIIGRIPRRFGHDGRYPASWADGRRGWDGWLPAAEHPRIVDPPSGRVWTANARVVAGENLSRVGFGGYDLGARQRQIRDALLATPRASETDMLRIQLDDRALFLERWQKLLLATLTPDAVSADPRRAEARRFVAAWGGRASVDSVGYRIVRAFRVRAAEEALTPLTAPCRRADAQFDLLGRRRAGRAPGQWEGPLWRLLSERPSHLLDPRFESWDALLLSALDGALDDLAPSGASPTPSASAVPHRGRDAAGLASRTWGERNTTRVRHPLSESLPGMSWLLDMPRRPLPGDSHMPRVQGPAFGASERFAVSPGHEERGYFHMPGGQSAHPLSPHYADGHDAWATGRPTPFLAGPPVHVLTLSPR